MTGRTVAGRPAQAGRPGYVVEHTSKPHIYRFVRECPWCHKEAAVDIPAQGLWDWEHGAFVQTAFPDLSPNSRELIMTGTHPTCWNQMFPPEED